MNADRPAKVPDSRLVAALQAALFGQADHVCDREMRNCATAILAGLPEGTALVTVETLAEGLQRTEHGTTVHRPSGHLVAWTDLSESWRADKRRDAAAIIGELRRGRTA
jgi:hypothetical protein